MAITRILGNYGLIKSSAAFLSLRFLKEWLNRDTKLTALAHELYWRCWIGKYILVLNFIATRNRPISYTGRYFLHPSNQYNAENRN